MPRACPTRSGTARAIPFGRFRRLCFAAPLIAFPAFANADAPAVAVDIAPLHSLVAQVMEGVGEPALVIPPVASPHEYSLRPSEARALQDADLVFWIGPDLTPWLADAIETLAADAEVTEMLGAGESITLDFREGAAFEAHDHGHKPADQDLHTHNDEHAAYKDDAHEHDDHEHDDHEHDDHEHGDDGHGDHDHGDHGHDGHAHGKHDPHAWLSPQNAAIWIGIVAERLAAADPANESSYAANAVAAKARLKALETEIEARLAPVRGAPFIVFHDAYQYFETRFDIPAAGAISLSDATDPSPARLEEIRTLIAERDIACVLAEPQFDPGIVATVAEGTEAATAVLDPLGATLTPGPDLYTALISKLADALADCL